MKKIPTLFERGEDRRSVADVVTPGCEWVLTGQGVATRKFDGTCVMIDANGQAWARREVKPEHSWPPGVILADHDLATGKDFGWEPAEQSGFAKYIAEATSYVPDIAAGTYELIGPKVQGNPEGCVFHTLVRHGGELIDPAPPLTFSGLRDWMLHTDFEGIVWHHPDGRMAKHKRRDFPRAVRP